MPSRSTGAWTSARPRCLRPTVGGSRTTSSTSSTSPRSSASRSTSARAARSWRVSHAGESPRWSSAGRGSTCAPCSTTSASRAATRRSGRAGRRCWLRSAPERLHAVLAERDPEGGRGTSCPPTGVGSCGPSRSARSRGSRSPRSCPPMARALVPHLSVGLDLPRDVLDERIRARVAPDVRRRPRRRGPRPAGHGPARGPHGQPGPGLPPGDRPARRHACERAQAEEDIVLGTRRFARRQQRWFHRDPRTVWLDAMAPASSTASLDRGPDGRACP